MQQHHYLVLPEGIDHRWSTPIELYCYVYTHPEERQRLLAEVIDNPGARRTYQICHPCSNKMRLAPYQSDEDFVRQLEFLIRREVEEWESHIR